MSSTSDCDFDARSWGLDLSDEVIKLLNDNFEKMLEFVKPTWEKENIPMWEPPENIRGTLSPDRLDFIRNLRIPSFEPSSTPSLLLHELGNYAEDQNMDQRIQELFKKGCLTCVMNCSGAGKTRHALEALCHQWGFYFCLKDKEGDLGSGDMNNIIHRLTLRKEKGYFTSHLPRYSNDDEFEKFKAKLENNQLLFITAIVKSGRKISASDKRRWTLLQIHPAFLGSINADIFLDLARYLDSPNYAQRKLIPTMTTDGFEELWQQILQAVSELITAHSDHPPDQKVDNKAYSFVLDEAQLAAGMRNAFRSGEPNSRGIYEQRPLLREFIVILNFLVLAGLAAILTGTGLDIEVIEDAAHSVAYKGTPRYSMFKTTIGGFYEDPRAHIAYLNKFVPPDVLSRESLIKRMSIWLTGRYRTTASAISYLLETGFENPHDELDNWIMLNTGFIPSDSPNSEIRLPLNIGEHRNTLIKQLKYSKIAKSASTRELFVNTIFESFVRSSALDITRASHVLVEAGFARFTQKEKLGETCLFEPLIILAAIWQIEQAENEQGSARNAFGEYFMRKVESATLTRLGSQHNGFESYVALVLARAFGNFAPLSDVFSFDEKYNPVWMRNRRARLVSIHREDGPGSTARVYPVNWPEYLLPTGHLGRQCRSEEATLEWLNHCDPFRAPICFPSQNMGPDVILKLQLDDDDGSFVWVVVQCKNWSGGEKIHGDPAQIAEKEKKAIKTVTPRKFWMLQNGTAYKHVKCPNLRKEAAMALATFPNPDAPKKATLDRHGFRLLRVLAFFPLHLGLESVDEEVLNDPGHHPICTINWDKIILEEDNRDFLNKWKTDYEQKPDQRATFNKSSPQPDPKVNIWARRSSRVQNLPPSSSPPPPTTSRKRKTPSAAPNISKRQRQREGSDDYMRSPSMATNRDVSMSVALSEPPEADVDDFEMTDLMTIT